MKVIVPSGGGPALPLRPLPVVPTLGQLDQLDMALALLLRLLPLLAPSPFPSQPLLLLLLQLFFGIYFFLKASSTKSTGSTASHL